MCRWSRHEEPSAGEVDRSDTSDAPSAQPTGGSAQWELLQSKSAESTIYSAESNLLVETVLYIQYIITYCDKIQPDELDGDAEYQ